MGVIARDHTDAPLAPTPTAHADPGEAVPDTLAEPLLSPRARSHALASTGESSATLPAPSGVVETHTTELNPSAALARNIGTHCPS